MDNINEDIERVVLKIFENQRKSKIPTTIVKDILLPHFGQERYEFELLQEIIDVCSIGGEISEDEMKSVLLQFMDKLKSDDLVLNDISIKSEINVSNQGQYLSNSIASTPSKDFQEYVEDLQNQIAKKDHLINKYRNQIDSLSIQIQQQDEAHNALILDREKLQEKLYNEKQQNNSLKVAKAECNELIETLHVLNKNKLIMERQLKALKKENALLNESIAILDTEKQNLTIQLTDTKQLNAFQTKSLNEIQCYVDELKEECTRNSEKITEQAKYIQYLSDAKKSLEIELHNAIDKTNFDKHPISLNSDGNSPEYTLHRNFVENLDDNKLDIPKTNHMITSTPYNNVSLMQELNESYKASPIIERKQINLFSTPIIHSNFSTNCDNSAHDNSSFTDYDFKIMPTMILPSDKRELCAYQETAMENREEDEMKISSMTCTIQTLKMTIANMKSYQLLLEMHNQKLCNTFKEAMIRNKILHYIIKERSVWLKQKSKQISDSEKAIKSDIPDVKKYSNRCISSCVKFIRIVFFLCAILCIIIALIQIYSKLRYCNTIRRGRTVNVIPWSWITASEFIRSIFDFKYDEGPLVF